MPQPRQNGIRLGESVQGRAIDMVVFEGTAPAVLIFGGIHGDEPTSVELTQNLITLLNQQPQLTGGRRVAIIPVANPDGLAKGTRTNANAIDVNRNFPARNFKPGGSRAFRAGVKPASEPETRALLAAIQQVKPSLIVSIHSISRGRKQNNYDGPAERFAKAMATHNSYPVTANIGYPTPGSFGSYAGGDLQIPVITLELPREQPGPQAWNDNREALLEIIRMR